MHGDGAMWIKAFTKDLRTAIYEKSSPGTNSDIWTYDVASGRSLPLVQSAAYEGGAQLSPDQRWLAYVADGPAGGTELYVTSFPTPGRRWQVTTAGASEIRWSRDGRELFYRHDNHLMSVPVETGASFVAGKAQVLFDTSEMFDGPAGFPMYDVSEDGRRFLMLRQSDTWTFRVIQGFDPSAAR
jgi:Tol biopolymer transport system component